MVTIREISRIANVSIATVSKVLNGKGGVSQATTDKVMAIAQDINYRPNLTARSLKQGQSHTIGVITEDLTVFNTPEIVDGIDSYCDSKGFHYLLGNMRFYKRFGNKPKNTKECVDLISSHIDTMLSKQVDGIIYVGCHSHSIAAIPNADNIPIVFAYCYSLDQNIPAVLYDDHKAAFDATQLLINRGHKKIGVIAGQRDSLPTANRLLGFQEALFSNSIPYNPNLIYYGDWEREKGYDICEKLVQAGVTAIFAQNDLMATGAIDYCNKHNIQVGKDIALIGFDNREISTVCRPTLSTVSLPLFEIGQTSTRILLDILENRYVTPGQKVMLACTVIERESTCTCLS